MTDIDHEPGVAGEPHAAGEPHTDDAPGHGDAVAHHTTSDHGDDHGRDDHAHGDEPLGPVDLPAWGAGVLGVLLGLAVTLAFVLATASIQGT